MWQELAINQIKKNVFAPLPDPAFHKQHPEEERKDEVAMRRENWRLKGWYLHL